MAVTKTKQAEGVTNPFALLAKYMDYIFWGAVIIAFIVIWPWLKKYIMNMTASNKDSAEEIAKDQEYKSNQNPEVMAQKLKANTTREDIHAAAKSLAQDLGTKYDDGGYSKYFNWSYWTENDESAANALIKQRLNYKLVEKCYFVVTRSRNLTNDVLQYLDAAELKRVKQYINL